MDDLLARDRAHLIHPQHDRATCDAAHVWVKGEGALLTDASGSQYLDGLAGLWNVIAGHGSSLLDAAAKKTRGLNIASRVVSHHRVNRPRLVSSHGTGPPMGGGLYPGG